MFSNKRRFSFNVRQLNIYIYIYISIFRQYVRLVFRNQRSLYMHIDNYIILLGKEIVLQLDLSDRLLQTKGGFIFLCLVLCQSQFLVRSFSPARKLLSLKLKTSMHVVKNAEFHSAF